MRETSIMASKKGTPLTPEELRMAANLRRLREQSGMTLDRVANALGVTNQAVNQYEKGRSRIGPTRIGPLLDLFQVGYKELVGGSAADDAAERPRLFQKPTEEPFASGGNDLETNVADHFEGLRIEGEVAAGRWIEVHGDVDGELSYHDIYDNVPVALDHRWPRAVQYGLIVRGTSINNVAIDGDVLTCVGLHETSYRLREYDLVIVEQRRDAGLLIERTAKRWLEHDDRYELWPDSSDPRWQTPIVVPKKVGFENEAEDGITISVKAFVTWIHRPIQTPVRRKR